MLIAMSTVSGTPRLFKSRSTGGNISKWQCEVTIFEMIAPALMPSLCMRRTSLLCRTGIGVAGGDSAWPKAKQQFARSRAATTNEPLHFMVALRSGSKLVLANLWQPICQAAVQNNPDEIGFGRDRRVLVDERLRDKCSLASSLSSFYSASVDK